MRLLVVVAMLEAIGCGPDLVLVGDSGFVQDFDAGSPFPLPSGDPVLELGRTLFFEKALSGRRDIACATCHIVFTQTTEPLPLSIGTGALGLGPTRTRSVNGVVLARNASDLFHRQNVETTTLLWDGRVEMLEGGVIRAPIELPDGIETLLEAQALLPIVERQEMRGSVGTSELGDIADARTDLVFEAVMARLLALPDYRVMFVVAFPDVSEGEHTIVHLARALAHFQHQLWNSFDAPFDTKLEDDALWDGTLEGIGRTLFFGEAGCARCHGGALFSDQGFHNIAVPQLGPGKDLATGLDEGRFLVTGIPSDRFAFRTPSLRNVVLTGPYMHNGAYATLEGAIRHHFDPAGALAAYTGADDLPSSLASSVKKDQATRDAILSTLATDVVPMRPLSDADVLALIAFIETLTSADQLLVQPFSSSPSVVPSMIAIDTWPLGTPHPSRGMFFGIP